MLKYILTMMSGLMLAVAGCASARDRAVCSDTRFGPAAGGQRADLASALLFDRKPGRWHASDFAVRSDWPSTNAFYSPGQVIYFTERFVDHQGRWFGESDYTYRRFDSYRAGVGYR